MPYALLSQNNWENLLSADLVIMIMDMPSFVKSARLAVHSLIIYSTIVFRLGLYSERVWESAAGTIKILAEGDIAGGLPWELLMIAPPDRYRQKFEQPYLIGDRAIVYRPLKSVPSEGDLEKTTLRILALSHQHLPYAFREISTLERTLQGRAVVCHVDPVTSADIDLGVEQICKFIRDHSPCPIAHFACHNEVAQDPAKAFVIEVRDSFPFSRTHLNDKAFELTSNCFVFLNCCHSGASLSGPSSLVQYLLVKGAAAALATVCQIGDDYAEYMSQAVYKRMLPPHSQQGERLGEAVLGARMDLWRIKRSMAGYIYCLYGDPEWVI